MGFSCIVSLFRAKYPTKNGVKTCIKTEKKKECNGIVIEYKTEPELFEICTHAQHTHTYVRKK